MNADIEDRLICENCGYEITSINPHNLRWGCVGCDGSGFVCKETFGTFLTCPECNNKIIVTIDD